MRPLRTYELSIDSVFLAYVHGIDKDDARANWLMSHGSYEPSELKLKRVK